MIENTVTISIRRFKELERCEKVAEGEGILVVEKSYAYDNFSSKNYKPKKEM